MERAMDGPLLKAAPIKPRGTITIFFIKPSEKLEIDRLFDVGLYY